jgi:hypothetical protein
VIRSRLKPGRWPVINTVFVGDNNVLGADGGGPVDAHGDAALPEACDAVRVSALHLVRKGRELTLTLALGFGKQTQGRGKLGLEVCARWTSPPARGLWRGDALHRFSTGSPPVLHRFSTGSPPVLHRLSTDSPPALHRFSTGSPPVLHRLSTGSPPVLHPALHRFSARC